MFLRGLKSELVNQNIDNFIKKYYNSITSVISWKV